MAKQRKNASSSRFGGTLFTLLFGLILGLAIAAAVAYFVTQVPMPFADKASRSAPNVLLPDVRDAPDPNRALMGEGGAGSMADPDAITPPQALPGSDENPSLTDDIGALLATLGAPTDSASANASSPPAPSTPAAATQTTYYLQAGAFRSESDAEAMRARIILMGLPTQVQSAQVNGATLYRVRLGPFRGIDEMNQARAELSKASIESSVVRP
ncbi:MAG: cell division protein [Pusillimonas sp.]|nr:cell division protein [Pusillimonas sp.]